MSDSIQLGRYSLEEKIGEGAFAEVFRARDAVLSRTVALKVLKAGAIRDEVTFARFRQEAQVAAGLFHPGIATVLDLGEAEGRFFLAMRFVDGPALDELLAENGPLPWERALAILEQVAGALAFAHEQGLVHRDVKPQNILVSEKEGAVLTDFGLVKAAQASGMTLTTAGTFPGTPSYLAPEIWKDRPATPACDQYALACVLVEMLSGEVLFGGDSTPGIMMKHFQPPELPEQWPVDVPDGFDEVLRRALDQEPAARFDSVLEFVAALAAPQAPSPAPAAQPAASSDPDNPAGIEWVEIPAGEFLYGKDKERTYLRKPFLIGKYPVTNAQYQKFIDANPDHDVPYGWLKKKRRHPPEKAGHPVVEVSWHDAVAFCEWAGGRLPTEQEWEKAARGEDGRTYPWGEDWLDGKYCNSEEAGIGDTTPVDDFPAGVSPYGVWDMSGNVWEWTASWYDDDKDTRVLRGGSWYDNERGVRAADRDFDYPASTVDLMGFRCARSL